VPQDVDVRVPHRGDHAPGHLRRLHAQLGVHAGDHHVEPVQELLLLVEAPVEEDVDLDAAEDPEGRQLLVQAGDDLELRPQTLWGEAVGHGEPGAVVGEHHVLVPQVPGRPGHLVDGAAPVRPVRMRVAVAPKRGADLGRPPVQGRGSVGRGVLLQAGQVLGHPTSQGLGHHLLGLGAHALQVAEATLLGPSPHVLGLEGGQRGRRPAEGTHPVGGGTRSLEQVGDALECLDGVHGRER
jgi:hypothetical protein